MADLLRAVRGNYRFHSGKGHCNMEDLWMLPLSVVNNIAKSHHEELKKCEEVDFLGKRKPSTLDLENKFEIVKEVISIRLSEIEDKEMKVKKDSDRAEIKEIIKAKRGSALRDLSVEELEAKLKE